MKRFIKLFSLLLISINSFAQVPPYTATVYDTSSTGYYFLCAIRAFGNNRYDVQMILDRNGDVIYYDQLPQNQVSFGFTLQRNGLMSYNLNGKFYLMDSTFTLVDSISFQNGYSTDMHELQILPNGHFLLLGGENVTMDLSSYPMFSHNGSFGSANANVSCSIIQELDENKNVVFEWHTKDHFAFDDVDEFWLNNPNTVDWTHCNALELDTDGNILLSSRHFDEITKINRSDSSIMWRFGGKRNEFTFLSDTVRFYGQHDVRRLDNGHVTLFDNGNHGVNLPARAVEYSLDEINKTADLKWSYIYDSAMYSTAMGSFQRMQNSNSLVDYGILNTNNVCFVVVDSMHSKVFEIAFDSTLLSYRAFNYPTLPWALHRPEITCFDSAGTSYLDAGTGYSSYAWNDGSTTKTIAVTSADTFSVFVPYGQGFISSEKFIVSNVNDACGTFTSLSENSADEIKIFPNPVSEKLSVTGYSLKEDEIIFEIYNSIGERIFADKEKGVAGKFSKEFSLKGFAPGMYFLKMNEQVVKFVKE